MDTKLNKLKDTFNRKNTILKKKQYEYEVYGNEVFRIKNLIDFIENSRAVKPQILFNQGRDGKYIYGQMYYLIEPQSTTRRSYRFMIGKTSENVSRKLLEKKCLEVFYDRYISSYRCRSSGVV